MGEPSLLIQTAVRARLIASPAMMELVPADHIICGRKLPELDREILIGEGLTVFDPFYSNVHLDLHVWVKETGFDITKAIASAAYDALQIIRDPWMAGESMVHRLDMSARYLRDPHGEYAHGVLSLDALMQAAP